MSFWLPGLIGDAVDHYLHCPAALSALLAVCRICLLITPREPDMSIFFVLLLRGPPGQSEPIIDPPCA
eukprot:2177485-Pyramimonas_sp.AAC.1